LQVTILKPIPDSALRKQQLDSIEQFEADYNTIDVFLRKALGADKQTPFTHLVREYFRQHAGWRDAELLATVAEIRNAIVHGKTEPYRYVAVPTPAIAAQLGACRERLIDIRVGHVLENEEERGNWQFVSRDTHVDDVRVLFGTQVLLEAVLITASGKQSEKLLGIATRWDMLQLK
jgi:hypothetical protein